MTTKQLLKKHRQLLDKLDAVLSKEYQMILSELLELEHELSLLENQ